MKKLEGDHTIAPKSIIAALPTQNMHFEFYSAVFFNTLTVGAVNLPHGT
jgi:hypothetical protein